MFPCALGPKKLVTSCFMLELIPAHQTLATKFWPQSVSLSASWSSFGLLLPPHATSDALKLTLWSKNLVASERTCQPKNIVSVP